MSHKYQDDDYYDDCAYGDYNNNYGYGEYDSAEEDDRDLQRAKAAMKAQEAAKKAHRAAASKTKAMRSVATAAEKTGSLHADDQNDDDDVNKKAFKQQQQQPKAKAQHADPAVSDDVVIVAKQPESVPDSAVVVEDTKKSNNDRKKSKNHHKKNKNTNDDLLTANTNYFLPADKAYNRILWDPSVLDTALFELGYEDRFAGVLFLPISKFRGGSGTSANSASSTASSSYAAAVPDTASAAASAFPGFESPFDFGGGSTATATATAAPVTSTCSGRGRGGGRGGSGCGRGRGRGIGASPDDDIAIPFHRVRAIRMKLLGMDQANNNNNKSSANSSSSATSTAPLSFWDPSVLEFLKQDVVNEEQSASASSPTQFGTSTATTLKAFSRMNRLPAHLTLWDRERRINRLNDLSTTMSTVYSNDAFLSHNSNNNGNDHDDDSKDATKNKKSSGLLTMPSLSMKVPPHIKGKAVRIVKPSEENTAATAIASSSCSVPLKIISYNILHDLFDAKKIYSKDRMRLVLRELELLDADIVFLQEMTSHAWKWLRDADSMGESDNDEDEDEDESKSKTKKKSNFLTSNYHWTRMPPETKTAQVTLSKFAITDAVSFSTSKNKRCIYSVVAVPANRLGLKSTNAKANVDMDIVGSTPIPLLTANCHLLSDYGVDPIPKRKLELTTLMTMMNKDLLAQRVPVIVSNSSSTAVDAASIKTEMVTVYPPCALAGDFNFGDISQEQLETDWEGWTDAFGKYHDEGTFVFNDTLQATYSGTPVDNMLQDINRRVYSNDTGDYNDDEDDDDEHVNKGNFGKGSPRGGSTFDPTTNWLADLSSRHHRYARRLDRLILRGFELGTPLLPSASVLSTTTAGVTEAAAIQIEETKQKNAIQLDDDDNDDDDHTSKKNNFVIGIFGDDRQGRASRLAKAVGSDKIEKRLISDRTMLVSAFKEDLKATACYYVDHDNDEDEEDHEEEEEQQNENENEAPRRRRKQTPMTVPLLPSDHDGLYFAVDQVKTSDYVSQPLTQMLNTVAFLAQHPQLVEGNNDDGDDDTSKQSKKQASSTKRNANVRDDNNDDEYDDGSNDIVPFVTSRFPVTRAVAQKSKEINARARKAYRTALVLLLDDEETSSNAAGGKSRYLSAFVGDEDDESVIGAAAAAGSASASTTSSDLNTKYAALPQCVDRFRSKLKDKAYPRWMPHATLMFPFVGQEMFPEAIEMLEAHLKFAKKQKQKQQHDDSTAGLFNFLSDDGMTFQLQRVDRFINGSKAVVHLVPEQVMESDNTSTAASAPSALQNLYDFIAPLFPCCARSDRPPTTKKNDDGDDTAAAGAASDQAEASSYHPHVTLGSASAGGVGRLMRQLQGEWDQVMTKTAGSSSPSPSTFKIKNLHLIAHLDDKDGYEVLHSFDLTLGGDSNSKSKAKAKATLSSSASSQQSAASLLPRNQILERAQHGRRQLDAYLPADSLEQHLLIHNQPDVFGDKFAAHVQAVGQAAAASASAAPASLSAPPPVIDAATAESIATHVSQKGGVYHVNLDGGEDKALNEFLSSWQASINDADVARRLAVVDYLLNSKICSSEDKKQELQQLKQQLEARNSSTSKPACDAFFVEEIRGSSFRLYFDLDVRLSNDVLISFLQQQQDVSSSNATSKHIDTLTRFFTRQTQAFLSKSHADGKFVVAGTNNNLSSSSSLQTDCLVARCFGPCIVKKTFNDTHRGNTSTTAPSFETKLGLRFYFQHIFTEASSYRNLQNRLVQHLQRAALAAVENDNNNDGEVAKALEFLAKHVKLDHENENDRNNGDLGGHQRPNASIVLADKALWEELLDVKTSGWPRARLLGSSKRRRRGEITIPALHEFVSTHLPSSSSSSSSAAADTLIRLVAASDRVYLDVAYVQDGGRAAEIEFLSLVESDTSRSMKTITNAQNVLFASCVRLINKKKGSNTFDVSKLFEWN